MNAPSTGIRLTPFRDLRLGKTSAEEEGATDPKLLLDGFFDTNGVAGEAREGPRFLILGYKGSGKSAISEHLRLAAESDSQCFVKTSFLADFPYADFGHLIQGDDPYAKYPTAWAWLLLVKLFDSFIEDQSAELPDEFSKMVQVLERLGLLPSRNLKELVLTSSTRTFKVKLPVVFESEFRHDKHEQNLKLPFMVEKLRKLATCVRSEAKHILIVDGLDDIFTAAKLQYESLAGLLLEVSRLNAEFRKTGTPAKILLLCRTDLYENIPGANKNKIRQDSAIVLDWYHDPREPGESDLVKLINIKARVTEPKISDLFTAYLPTSITFRKSRTEQAMVPYLLGFTRHTPRDFIQLLTHIQRFTKPPKTPHVVRRAVTAEEILSGIRSYSINYFLPEIKDELVGYFTAKEVDAAFSLIGSLRRRQFRFSELTEKAKSNKRFCDLDVTAIVTALFECSAIENVHFDRAKRPHFYSKYRNRNSTLNLEDQLLLHRGLWKAFNIG